ncbi:uncharacterized protein DUF3892 [Larkinella arboricola]|uniref:Uncharacterized protein DUF3892 n=1 Tax=Larkinella arboricola TaxID=643671 RepID=A0A327WRG6_LARAB|nr:DUF3892 domain-containing protein [Larkinella arboricola]RAJ93266.1 uncharacterized protein DUF3892 [Larkinella arboricola]
MANRITHLRRSQLSSTEEHITDVKGVTDGGKHFELSVSQVIHHLKKNYVFYVQLGTRKAMVTYHRNATGTETIRINTDRTSQENLGSLPSF